MTQEEPPLLRPYTLTRGRTKASGAEFDLLEVISAVPGPYPPTLTPEHLRILQVCQTPRAVVDLASDARITLNIARILLGDLRDQNLITVRPKASLATRPEERILREVIQGLRAL